MTFVGRRLAYKPRYADTSTGEWARGIPTESFEQHQDIALKRIEVVVRHQPEQRFAPAPRVAASPSRLSTA